MNFFSLLLIGFIFITIGFSEEMKIKIPTADTSWIKHKHLDISYDTHSPSQKLDIYLPDNLMDKHPVIIAIHGGAFMMGDKADIQLKAPLEGVKRNYAVVSLNYRLSGEAIFPAQINDITKAIIFVKENAKTYHLDSNKIALWGGSAGGNLSALAGTLCSKQDTLNKLICNVQAVVDWFGPINFLTMDQQFLKSGKAEPSHSASNSPESQYLGATITHIQSIVTQANPETYISPQTPPFFIQHGDEDPLVPLEQSIEFSHKLINVIGDKNVKFEILKGAKHGGSAFESAENLDKIFNFLDYYLKND